MSLALLSPTVPAAQHICQECWTVTTEPLTLAWDEMVCAECAEARWTATEAKYLPAEYDDWAIVKNDRLDKISDVLHGMGF